MEVSTNQPKQIKEEADYYFENGLVVFAEQYHLKRGFCCKNNCRHCPYGNSKQQTKA
ncbi:MAG: hypothetical protein IPJ20_25215 [Flammeovirgaceae bacterium]|nr:hypothetical protein [Flammeovirgaceae bacterium]